MRHWTRCAIAVRAGVLQACVTSGTADSFKQAGAGRTTTACGPRAADGEGARVHTAMAQSAPPEEQIELTEVRTVTADVAQIGLAENGGFHNTPCVSWHILAKHITARCAKCGATLIHNEGIPGFAQYASNMRNLHLRLGQALNDKPQALYDMHGPAPLPLREQRQRARAERSAAQIAWLHAIASRMEQEELV
eukprot:gene38410-8392_t